MVEGGPIRGEGLRQLPEGKGLPDVRPQDTRSTGKQGGDTAPAGGGDRMARMALREADRRRPQDAHPIRLGFVPCSLGVRPRIVGSPFPPRLGKTARGFPQLGGALGDRFGRRLLVGDQRPAQGEPFPRAGVGSAEAQGRRRPVQLHEAGLLQLRPDRL